MITFKCKMCGGDLCFEPDASVVECPYCGTNQTLPKLDDDKRANLYDRANHFRRQNEFDKAMVIYEQVLAEDRTDAEAYWSMVLCRYGIEYVEDPASHKRVPTVNRMQYASILADEDYKAALAYADAAQRCVYEAEANAIAEIQKGILDISRKEEPFDVFICYKEADANGRRTPDSVLANDLYHQLTNEGFKVFFARNTLEDKIGIAYEPYIFAALNSAKVMVALGTKPDYFNAVWVKNEWSRYLALIRAGADKVLVPAYRDMDPYDLPEEFAHLQAQDMGKLGFIQDLIRGIKKMLQKEERKPHVTQQKVTSTSSTNIENLMKRAHLYMEDGDWKSANDYLNKVLDENAEYAPAYISKVQVVLRLRREEELSQCLIEYEKSPDWQKALRFATPEQRNIYEGYLAGSKAAREEKSKSYIYEKATQKLQAATTPEECEEARELFEQIQGYRDVEEKQRGCDEKAESIQSDWYHSACLKMAQPSESSIEEAKGVFAILGDYRDATKKAVECENLIYKIKKRNSLLVRMSVLEKNVGTATAHEWDELGKAFREIDDAEQLADRCAHNAEDIRLTQYNNALAAMKQAQNDKELTFAAYYFSRLGEYRDAAEKAKECESLAERMRADADAEAKAKAVKQKNRKIVLVVVVVSVVALALLIFVVIIPSNKYREAEALRSSGKYAEAVALFSSLGLFHDAPVQVSATYYSEGIAKRETEDWEGAVTSFAFAGEYSDAITQIDETHYQHASHSCQAGLYEEAYDIYTTIKSYRDVSALLSSDGNLKRIHDERLERYTTNGSVVTFGCYEQDGDEENGAERIEWIVLSVKDNKCFLVSQYAFDSMYQSSSNKEISWENSAVRSWLNNSFYMSAFNEKEIEAISGELTLLTSQEVSQYLPTTARICKPTIASGNSYNMDGVEWWLMTSPKRESRQYHPYPSQKWWTETESYWASPTVDRQGKISNSDVTSKTVYTRPCVWLDLSVIDTIV